MQTKRTADGAPTDSTLITLPAVAQRSARRATARQRKRVEGRIVEYMKDHPHGTRVSPTAR